MKKRTWSFVLAVCMMMAMAGSAFAAEAQEYPVDIHVMTIEERNELFYQSGREPAVGTAYLSRNNESGTNGAVCAPFTADRTGMAFVLTSAPGAENYNVQLYVGEIGNGERVSDYATAEVNNGVYFTGLEIGESYYFKISSSTLVTSGCTAVYEMLAFDAPAQN